MDSLIDVVNSLENKVLRLLKKLDEVNEMNALLSERLAISERNNEDLQQAVKDWEEKYNSLKIANSMLGSIQDKNEAKLKINTLIREIEHCIGQLSE